MKKHLLYSFLVVFLIACDFNEPLDYYNKAVGAGNSCIVLQEMESRLNRLESGMKLQPQNLSQTMLMRVSYNEQLLGKLEKLLGNDASDPMIQAAIDYLAYDIEIAKNPKTLKVFEAVGNAANFEEASSALEPMGDYLDEVYDTKDALYAIYDKEIRAYAAQNDIEEKFYGPGAPSGQ